MITNCIYNKIYCHWRWSTKAGGTAPQLVKLVEICLQSSYFEFQDSFFYEQIDGTAIGSPILPIIANLYTKSLEETAISSATFQPSMWVRYVDDTFVIWPHGQQELHVFHEHLNN